MSKIILFIILYILLFITVFYFFKKIRNTWYLLWYRIVKFKRNFIEKRKRKKLQRHSATFIRRGLQYFEKAEQNIYTLPQHWQKKLHPLINLSQYLIKNSAHKQKHAENIRNFYVLSLKTLDTFVTSLQEHHELMNEKENLKAQKNITLLKKDLLNYRQKLQLKRRFDFDVVMEVIKQRIGNKNK